MTFTKYNFAIIISFYYLFYGCATDEEQSSSGLNSYAVECPNPALNAAQRTPNAGDPYLGGPGEQYVRSGGDPYSDPILNPQFVRSGGDPYSDPILNPQFVRSGGDPYSGGNPNFALNDSYSPYTANSVITYSNPNVQMANAGDPLFKDSDVDIYSNPGDPLYKGSNGDRQLVNAGDPVVKDPFGDMQQSYPTYSNPCL